MRKHIIVYLIISSFSIFSQTKISGKVDDKGMKQGEWVYQYATHPLVPLERKTIVRCNYINDTLCGKYNVLSEDSTYKFYLNTTNNELKGFGYLIERGKIRRTYYYVNDNKCLVTEFDIKGKLYRTYETKDNKMNGVYMVFDKSKIIMKQYLKMDSLLSEEVNVFHKKK